MSSVKNGKRKIVKNLERDWGWREMIILDSFSRMALCNQCFFELQFIKSHADSWGNRKEYSMPIATARSEGPGTFEEQQESH